MAGSRYVFVETRDPFDFDATRFVADAATSLSARGRPVTVFLVQNAVLATRAGARGSQITRLAQAGVTVLADDFSLRERGIGAGEMNPAVREAPIEALVDLLTQGATKAVWH